MTEVKRENAVKIEGRQYIVVSPDLDNDWEVGTILTLSEDDGTNLPWFTDKSGNGDYVYMHEVMLLAEAEEKQSSTELPEHKYTVGQKLVVNSNRGVKWNGFDSGDKVTVVGLEGLGGDSHENGIPKYGVEDKDGLLQYLLETQLESVISHITEEQYAAIEVGDTIVIRDDLETGIYGNDSVTVEMLEYRGKQLEVESRSKYSGKVDSSGWNWTQQMIAGVVKKESEKQQHKYEVGDRVRIIETENSEKVGTPITGETATIEMLKDYSGRTHTENGTPYYKVLTDSGCTQVVTEYQLSKLDKKPEFLLEEGQFYLADQTGNYSHNWIIKAGEITDDSVEMGFALSTDDNTYADIGELPFSDVTKWTPTTDEQKIQLLTAMAENGDATESDLELLSELMPLDNPELEVGAVYYRKGGAIIRAEHNDTAGGSLTGNFLEGKTFLEKNGGRAYIDQGYRKALPHEVAKLETAEKEHGCEYKKPLINSKGTVIEVGQYYKSEANYGSIVYCVSEVTDRYFHRGDNYLELSTGKFKPTFVETVIGSIVGRSAVPAIPEEIAEFKAAESRSKISKGQKYLLNGSDGKKQEIEVTNVTSNGTVQFKYKSVFNNTVTAGLTVDSPYWKDAELVE